MPSRALSTIFVVSGIVALAGITLFPPATSRMYATPWNLLYWAVVVLPALAAFWRIASDRGFRFPTRDWTFLAVASAITILAAAVTSPHRGSALPWSALPLSGLALFLLVHDWLAQDAARIRRMDAALPIAATVVLVASIGWWLRDVASLIAGGRLHETFFEMRNPHPLGHSNYTAGLAVLALPWTLQAARRATGVGRVLGFVGTFLAVAAVFTSASRGGLIGLAAVALAIVAINGLERRRALLLAVVVVGVAVIALSHPRFRTLLAPRDPASPPSASTVQRTAMLAAGVALGKERPLLGWGLHTTPLVYPRVRPLLDGGAENVLQLHSLPVEVFAGLGVAGIALLLAAAALVVRHARQCGAAGAALLGYAAFSLTDHQLDVPVFVVALALFGARLAVGSPPAGHPERRDVPRSMRAGVGAVIVIALVAIVTLGRRDPTPHLNAEALALAQQPERRDEAAGLLRQSLRLNNDQEIAHFNLGWLLLVPDPAAAEMHFHAAARLVPDKGGVYFGLALARLNRGDTKAAAQLLALECINDPRFLASYWWTEPSIAALREPARAEFRSMLESLRRDLPAGSWAFAQAQQLEKMSAALGQPGPGRELAYRRQRTGYPVLMRDSDIAVPIDVLDVRDTEGFPATAPVTLPSKGWLPSPLLLKLLDVATARRQ
jgi:O-antigen ligase